MLRYRRLLGIALGAAVLDAICAFSGFGALMGIIDLMFGSGVGLREQVTTWLQDSRIVGVVGDQSRLASMVPESRFAGFAAVLGVVLFFSIVGAAMRYTHAALTITIAMRVVTRLRSRAFERLLHTPLELILGSDSGDQLSRIVADTSRLGRGFNALMGKALRDILMGVAFLTLALIYSPVLTGLFLLAAPLIYIMIRKFGKRIRRASKYAMRQAGAMVTAVQESVQAMAVVRVHNAEGYERRRFHHINRKLLHQELRARTARALSSPVIELIAIVGVMGVALTGAWVVFERQAADPTDMIKVLAALGMAGASLRPLANLNNDLQEAAAAAERIDEVLLLPQETSSPASPQYRQLPELPRHAVSLRFENVSYRYPGADRDALSDINLDIPFGQTLALVGSNGSGKSTLVSLLSRLMEPTTGRVLLDHHHVADHNLRSLRSQMAVVSQQPVLFAGTIADNIAYGRRHVARADIENAAQLALADGFITALPAGYDTPLGEGGTGLSGGQRQRLCIARAILRDPALLVLDEATSQIDTESEGKINQSLRNLRVGRTTLLIAHRMTTVMDADRIVLFHDGRIADAGTHDHLMQNQPLYRQLWTA